MSITGNILSILLLVMVCALWVWAFVGLTWESAMAECQRNNANGLQSMMIKKWYGWVVVDRPDFREYRYYPLVSMEEGDPWEYIKDSTIPLCSFSTLCKDEALWFTDEDTAQAVLREWQDCLWYTMIYKEPVEVNV